MPPRAASPFESTFLALLAGGRGTRLWPLSRQLKPKQLLDVTGEGPLLQRCLERVAVLAPPANVLLVTSEDLALASGRLLGLPARNVLGEPMGRNTAPAVALALAAAVARDPQAVVLCLPADHHVAHPARLRRVLGKAAREAGRRQVPVLIGVPPTSPSSDYGYIVPRSREGLRAVSQFAEKPALQRARRLIARGALWNTGMFVLPARATLEAMRALVPAVAAAVEDLPWSRPKALRSALADRWPRLEPQSFDTAVLERWDAVHVLEAADLGWSDVGSWEAIAALQSRDDAGNRARGPAFFLHASGCVTFQHDSSRTLVVLGAHDLMLVDTGDVVLAAPRSELGRLRELVAKLERARPELT